MAKISATEANRNVSKLLAKARRGEVVARLEPVVQAERISAPEERRKQWEEFMERLRNQPVLGIPRGSRNELYDD